MRVQAPQPMARPCAWSPCAWCPFAWRLCWLLLLALGSGRLAAQEFAFTAPPGPADASTPAVMRDLAERILPVYEDKDRQRYLTNLAALQLVARAWTAADDTRRSLRERRAGEAASPPAGDLPLARELLYDIYAQARAIEARDRLPFSQAFNQSFREIVQRLGDRDAHAVTTWFETPVAVLEEGLQRGFDRVRGQAGIDQVEAVDLVWKYLAYDAHRSFQPMVKALDVEEDRRRFITIEDVVIKRSGGGEIQARVVRPRAPAGPLPTLLEFVLDHTADQARSAAAHGYVGVVAYSRAGDPRHRGRIEPFRQDGSDARSVIRWIASQAWSDGRVGMVGEGYSGFAAWAAAKRPIPALKAIATFAPTAPGIDFPAPGRIFRNASYRWALNLSGTRGKSPEDDTAWQAREQAWFRSGRAYRDLDRRFGPRSDLFRTWLTHPSYDRYWQKMIPFDDEFARVDIPALTLAGYDGLEAGALHYFSEHLRRRPRADHRLLIGPYDGDAMREGAAPVLRRDSADATALIDLRELRYQWLDYVFKGGAQPALLKDRVNLSVAGVQSTGAGAWRHAPSLQALSASPLRLHLAPEKSGGQHQLLRAAPTPDSWVEQTVNLADRSQAAGSQAAGSQAAGSKASGAAREKASRRSAHPHRLRFVSEPLPQATDFAGVLSGLLDLRLNKQDVDFHLGLYERLADGTEVRLIEPWEFRASYAADPVNRRLLKAGVRQPLGFRSHRLISRRVAAGSRVVLVLGINLRPDRQINYGSGREVSEASIRDAGAPMRIRWYGGSHIDLPRFAAPAP